jgi:hypothetical protein
LTGHGLPRILEKPMRLHAIRRALTFAVLLPLVLLSVSGGGASLFRCQLTGAVSAAPCCPDEAAPAAGGSGLPATVAGVDCCQRETIAFVHPPAEAPSASGHDVSPVVSAAFVVGAPSLAAPSLVNFVRSAPPDAIPRPPLRLVKRSLLI